MRIASLGTAAILLLANVGIANAEPSVLSKTGHDVLYIKHIAPGSEGMSPEQIGLAKKFGTYQDVQNSVSIDQGRVWVGTVVTMANGICTESTSSIAGVPKGPGEPKLNVVDRIVPCPATQVN
ncbi:hypothetical protein H8F21_14155 [Pseudomonas sp. P66]|uniref:Uncharacterized protein n=1 Tax=Pseudomonas arcuscaelestis TaxID=2710591 RepID=A0ABS2BYL8_9PSED|nr:hypothetical protein [Pseudomonas arcuscaelestis]MBM5458707.1 hypothetical protein [Pseudomonas arcuscaelestis]